MKFLSSVAILFAVVGLMLSAVPQVMAADQHHDGTVVSATGGKLVMKGGDGKEHSHMIDAGTKITVKGKAGKLEDLKAGDKIKVTTGDNNKVTAVAVE